MIESSFAVNILSTFVFITAKVSSLSEVSNPSATVDGLSEGVNIPVVNEINALFQTNNWGIDKSIKMLSLMKSFNHENYEIF